MAEGRRDEGGSSQSLGPRPRSPPLSGENQSSQTPWELPCGTSGKTEGEREERSQECVCGGGGRSGKRPACVQNGEGVQAGHWALGHAVHLCNLILVSLPAQLLLLLGERQSCQEMNITLGDPRTFNLGEPLEAGQLSPVWQMERARKIKVQFGRWTCKLLYEERCAPLSAAGSPLGSWVMGMTVGTEL